MIDFQTTKRQNVSIEGDVSKISTQTILYASPCRDIR